MTYHVEINYADGEVEGRWVSVPDVQSNQEFAREMKKAINATPIYRPWTLIEGSAVGDENVQSFRIRM